MRRLTVARAIALAIILSLFLLTPVVFGADNQSCNLLSWNPNYPSQVDPGEAIQVRTTVDVACAQWRTFYSARVDLVDRSSGRLFSTSTFQIGWLPNVTATISNVATAPQSHGLWKLQLNLYIFEEAGLVSLFKLPFEITVGTANNSTQETSTTTAATSVAAAPQSAANEQPLAITTTAGGSPTESTSAIPYIVIGILAVTLVGSVLLIMKGRRSI